MILLFSLDNQNYATFGNYSQTIQGRPLSEWVKPLLLLGMDRLAFHHDIALNRTLLKIVRDFPNGLTFEMEFDMGPPETRIIARRAAQPGSNAAACAA